MRARPGHEVIKKKARTFAGHLEKTFKPNELPQNEDLEAEINKTLRNHYN
jgi:hypothetical protein